MIIGGPNLVRDSIVLSFDAYDANCYAGEPASNDGLYPSSSYGLANYGDGTGIFDGLQTSGVYNGWYKATINSTHTNNLAVQLRFGATYTANTTYTASIEFICPDGQCVAYLTGNQGVGAGLAFHNIPNLYYRTFTKNGTTAQQYWYIYTPSGLTSPSIIYYRNIFFTEKSYLVPQTQTSRSATNIVIDKSGNGNHGTMVNMAGTEVEHYKSGNLILPKENAYWYFPNTSSRITTSVGTLEYNSSYECWVNREASRNAYNMFMGRHLPYFAFRDSDIFFFSTAISGTQRSLSSNITGSNDTWYHLVFTLDYDGVNTTMSIYINGELDNSATYAGAQSNQAYTFGIGDGRSESSWYPFNGKVGMVKLYSKALTADEIRSNFNSTRNRFGI